MSITNMIPPAPYPPGLNAEDYYLDPVNGDDANDGRGTWAEPRPVKTWARLIALTGSTITVPTTVHLLDDMPRDAPGVLLPSGPFPFTLRGTPEVLNRLLPPIRVVTPLAAEVLRIVRGES